MDWYNTGHGISMSVLPRGSTYLIQFLSKVWNIFSKYGRDYSKIYMLR